MQFSSHELYLILRSLHRIWRGTGARSSGSLGQDGAGCQGGPEGMWSLWGLHVKVGWLFGVVIHILSPTLVVTDSF